MTFSAAIIAASTVASAAVSYDQAKDAKKQAKKDAAAQKEALASLQAEPTPVMPTADDDATRRARRRSIADQMRRRGRQSTILTDSDSTGSLGA